MTARTAACACLLLASTASAFVLETSARVEIVQSLEISLPDPPPRTDDDGLRLSCPEGVRAQVELVTDDGLGRVRQVSFLEQGAGWVRWREDPLSCRITVTIE